MTSDDNPYASPAAEALPLRQPAASYDDDDYRPAIKYPYVSAHGRATATVVLLALSVLLNGASLGFTVKSLGLLASAQRGESFTRAQLAEVEVIASRFASLLLIAFACRVLTIIAFLLWFYRVHRNLPALRAEHLKFTPGWAVGGWFVPVIGLFLPYQVMREVLRESDPARIDPKGSPASATLIGWWWGTFLLAKLLTPLGMKIRMTPLELTGLIGMARFDILTELLVIVAGICAIRIVRRIDRDQEERFQKLSVLADPNV